MTTIKRRISMMMFLAFVMFSVFIVGLAQGRVLSTPLKSEEDELSAVINGLVIISNATNIMQVSALNSPNSRYAFADVS